MKKTIAVIAALSVAAVTVLSGCGAKAGSQANGGKVKIQMCIRDRACTERVIGRVDRMASLLINEGLTPYGQPLKMKYRNSFTYQRNMFYRYSYKGKEYWGMDGRRITSFFSTGKNGTPIELYCNPSRPSQFYCPAEDRNMTAAKVVNVSLVTVFAAVIWIALLVERK